MGMVVVGMSEGGAKFKGIGVTTCAHSGGGGDVGELCWRVVLESCEGEVWKEGGSEVGCLEKRLKV